MSRRHPPEVKAQAEQLLAAAVSVGDVARTLAIPEMTVWGWYYRARQEGRLTDIVATRGTPDPADPLVLAQRVRALEQRLATMEEELQLLGKVSAFFAKQHRT
jgi:transposase-like protein